MKILLMTFATVLLLACAAAASPTVDFVGYSPYNSCGSPVSYQGLTFTDSSGTGGCSLPYEYVWCCNSPNTSGEPGLIYGYGTLGGNNEIDITATGGGTFTLNSVLMTLSWYTAGNPETISVTANGGAISTSITLVAGEQTYNFGSLFSNVTDVSFQGVPDGYWFMTDVMYNTTPEPGTLLTLGSGLLAGIGFIRRKLN